MNPLLRWLKSWWKERPFQMLWQGLPALLVLVGLLVAKIYYTAWNSLKVHDRYAAARQQAMNTGDLFTARIASERLIRVASTDGFLIPRLPEHVFNMALCMKGLGAAKDAASLFDKVAPLADQTVYSYPPGHLYMAKTLWNESRERNEELLSRIQRHLLRAATDEPGMEEAHQMLGELYLYRMDLPNARRHLLKAVDKRQECLLLLAILSQKEGDREAVRQWAGRAQTYFQQRLDASNVEDTTARVSLARALLLQADFPKALSVYQTGFERTGDPVYKAAMANLHAEWIMTDVNAGKSVPMREVLNKVRAGLAFDPANEPLLQHLIKMGSLEGPDAAEAKTTIQKMIAEGGNTGVLHFYLGVEALDRGEANRAREHFDLAFSSNPNLPQVANNMAMIISSGPTPDLERALSIIDPVVKRYPTLAPVLDTRGQILAKLKRWKDAIADLEPAVAGMPGNREIHGTLALCYENLGLSDLAAEHRRQASKGAPGPGQPRPPGG